MKKSFEVESDCLEIVRRIKAIDEDYFVMFNIATHKFELHSRAQCGGSYCLTFPFDTLDERAVDLVLKTRVQNSDRLFEEMERENRELERRQTKAVLNDFEEKIYDS